MNNLPAISSFDFGANPDELYEPEQAIRQHKRVALIAIAVLLLGFGLATAIVPIGGAVIANGQLSVESRVKRIAHPTGGVIAEINVKDGDRVRRGQILMRLDDSVSGISADLTGRSVDQLLALRARLESERDGLSSISFPTELTGKNTDSARTAMASEIRAFGLKTRENTGIQAQLAARVRQFNQQISGYTSQIGAIQKQQALITPERDGVRELWDKGLVTINRLNELERTSVDMDGTIASLRARIAETEARISETREQMISVNQSRRSDAAKELAQVNEMLNDQQMRSASANESFERSVIRAPYKGVVDKLAFSVKGDVITPAETIMEIVPDADQLIVDAAISPMDVDRVAKGQSARIRLSALNSQLTPEIPGTVTFVSAERTEDKETKASFYRVRIALDQTVLAKEKLPLRPGMPAEAFIATGSRSMLSYITKPLRDQFARAFRD